MSSGCHQSAPRHADSGQGELKRIVLVGNPNVGKSVIFAHLTGAYVTVSNYPGTTVELTQGRARFDRERLVIDTPGVNSLVPRSEDERIARDILVEDGDRLIVQVADAKNLRRALVLSSQLAEMEVPFMLDLNMWDEAQNQGIRVDTERLAQLLGVPVIRTVAIRRQGLSELDRVIGDASKSTFKVRYDPDIEEAVARIEALLPPLPISRRSVALMWLSGDDSLKDLLSARLGEEALRRIDEVSAELQSRRAKSIGYLISKQRAEEIRGIWQQVSLAPPSRAISLADSLGRWSMHPIAGIPIMLLILYLFYKLVGDFGAGTVVDFTEATVFGEYINPWATRLLEHIPVSLFQELMVGQYGLITMGLTYAIAIILPVVSLFFFAFSIIEDVGYLPRLALMANKALKRIGLSGKAVLPMVLGLGCGTMAILTTRTLETKRERLIASLLLGLAIPCSAQLAVIAAMLGGLSATALLLFIGVIFSQLLLVGYLASRVIPGESPDFIMEVPPIRMPHISNVLTKTMARAKWYLKEAVPLFLLGTIILFFMDKTGLLSVLESGGKPIVQSWLGLPAEATAAFLLGFLRRDYGAAGLYVLAAAGAMNVTQMVVSLVVITLFLPCIAMLMVMVKERGLKTTLGMVGFIFPFAILVGGVLNLILETLNVQL